MTTELPNSFIANMGLSKTSLTHFLKQKIIILCELKFYEMINAFLLLNSFCNSFFGYLAQKINKKIKNGANEKILK
jgi:hypothetical protein